MLTQENDLAAVAAVYREAQAAVRALQDTEGNTDGWVSAINAMDAATVNLRRVAALAPEHRTRSADIYDPLTGLFKPTQVPETLRLAPRERIPGDRIVISLEEFDRLQALEVDTEIASLGPPDPAEHDRVAAALEKGGTIAEGARVLGVSKRRMKLLIVQHRVTWPRARILPRKPASIESLVDFLGLGDYMREKVAEGETRMDEIRRQIMPGTAAAVDAGGDHALGSGEPKP